MMVILIINYTKIFTFELWLGPLYRTRYAYFNSIYQIDTTRWINDNDFDNKLYENIYFWIVIRTIV